jgi:hypothetical protein
MLPPPHGLALILIICVSYVRIALMRPMIISPAVLSRMPLLIRVDNRIMRWLPAPASRIGPFGIFRISWLAYGATSASALMFLLRWLSRSNSIIALVNPSPPSWFA